MLSAVNYIEDTSLSCTRWIDCTYYRVARSSIELLNFRNPGVIYSCQILKSVQFASNAGHDISFQSVPEYFEIAGNVLADRLMNPAYSVTDKTQASLSSGDLGTRLEQVRHQQSHKTWFSGRTKASTLFAVDFGISFSTAISSHCRINPVSYTTLDRNI